MLPSLSNSVARQKISRKNVITNSPGWFRILFATAAVVVVLLFVSLMVVHEHRHSAISQHRAAARSASASDTSHGSSPPPLPPRATAALSKYSDAMPAPAQELVRCINSHQPSVNVTTWESAMADRMTAVSVARVWWSQKPAAVPLTVVTQLTFDRVEQLFAQCRSWAGPISAAIYMPIVDPHALIGGVAALTKGGWREKLALAIAEATELHKAVEEVLPCQLDLMLVYEVVSEERTTMLYPVNILRNYARLQARTPLLGLFDADMLVSRGLLTDLQSPSTLAALLRQARARVLLVLPSFVTYPAGGLTPEFIADKMANTSKAVVKTMWGNQVITRFDPGDEGHNATNYKKWLNTTEQYSVKYKFRYEPWVVADRLGVPFYDARFRGYGQNKIIHCEYMNYTGYTYAVHPNAWLVHRYHPPTRVKLQHYRDAHPEDGSGANVDPMSSVYGHSSNLGKLVREGMANGTYRPVLDAATVACVKELPWWGSSAYPELEPLLGAGSAVHRAESFHTS